MSDPQDSLDPQHSHGSRRGPTGHRSQGESHVDLDPASPGGEPERLRHFLALFLPTFGPVGALVLGPAASLARAFVEAQAEAQGLALVWNGFTFLFLAIPVWVFARFGVAQFLSRSAVRGADLGVVAGFVAGVIVGGVFGFLGVRPY